MQTLYATALKRLLASGHDPKKIEDGLIAHLQKRGRTKLLPGILEALQIAKVKEAQREGMLEVASEHEQHAAKAEAKELGIESKTVTINPSLIRGWRAKTEKTLIDKSGKRGLIDLYRNITRA